MVRRLKQKKEVLADFVDEALGDLATATKEDRDAARAAEAARTKAAEIVRKAASTRETRLRDALQSASSLAPDAMDSAFALLFQRAARSCSGAHCGLGCGVGCGGGCAIAGGATVGFGAAGGTAGGAGTAIAMAEQ